MIISLKQEIEQEWYADGLSFKCTQCGSCCTGPEGFVWFTDEEAEQMADYLGLPLDEFLCRYARQIGDRWSLNEELRRGRYDCIFLERDDQGRALCGIYEARPTQCRTWPFWPENLESPRTWGQAASGCPGMNVELSPREDDNFFPIEKIRILRDQTEM